MSGSSCTFCRASPWADPPDPEVLDEEVATINLEVVRLTLHVLAATIWVGGQIVLLALVGPLRRTMPAPAAPASRVFAWVPLRMSARWRSCRCPVLRGDGPGLIR
jgi:hypothetical protein